jgi:hypothetical protein
MRCCGGRATQDAGGLSLVRERRRGHGVLYDAVSHGQISVARLLRVLAGLLLPRPPTAG